MMMLDEEGVEEDVVMCTYGKATIFITHAEREKSRDEQKRILTASLNFSPNCQPRCDVCLSKKKRKRSL